MWKKAEKMFIGREKEKNLRYDGESPQEINFIKCLRPKKSTAAVLIKDKSVKE